MIVLSGVSTSGSPHKASSSDPSWYGAEYFEGLGLRILELRVWGLGNSGRRLSVSLGAAG